MYILDTDHISVMESAGSTADGQRLRFRMARLKPEERITTIITFEEQVRGWMSFLAQARTLQKQVGAYSRLKDVLDRYLKITALEFDEAAALEFTQLKDLRLRIGTMDLKIAAIALAHRATLLTRNVKDFAQVPRLRVEDWTQ